MKRWNRGTNRRTTMDFHSEKGLFVIPRVTGKRLRLLLAMSKGRLRVKIIGLEILGDLKSVKRVKIFNEI